ncbi:unnamed protein product [Pleuronectes platessa]|uniref:Uncharacterized protein n=1 Tax=Pleuronectes platessa TaxID=8262 RepID=A0A9N7UX95_PLEPL|nr:unnamed protein product [Pleuronectes platessa]
MEGRVTDLERANENIVVAPPSVGDCSHQWTHKIPLQLAVFRGFVHCGAQRQKGCGRTPQQPSTATRRVPVENNPRISLTPPAPTDQTCWSSERKCSSDKLLLPTMMGSWVVWSCDNGYRRLVVLGQPHPVTLSTATSLTQVQDQPGNNPSWWWVVSHSDPTSCNPAQRGNIRKVFISGLAERWQSSWMEDDRHPFSMKLDGRQSQKSCCSLTALELVRGGANTQVERRWKHFWIGCRSPASPFPVGPLSDDGMTLWDRR